MNSTPRHLRVSLAIQLLGMIGVLILAGAVIWAAITSTERNQRELRAQVQIDFELAKAEICAIAGVLSLPQGDRTMVQQVVDDCLSQVHLPGVEIEVPTNGSS